ncbi:hypothetical protein [Bradyrhizobium liaoningense]
MAMHLKFALPTSRDSSFAATDAGAGARVSSALSREFWLCESVMLGWGEIDALERQLRSSVAALNKKGIEGATLVEAIDEAALWPDDFEDVLPLAPSGTSLDALLSRAPLLTCAVAAEIGFRFEGVGTDYWAKFADAIGLSITMAQRAKVGDVFDSLARKYKISRPSESAFSAHFSIISWPIANALLPVDLVGAVARMMARAPMGALPGPGRAGNFQSLRAWAAAAEGARLVDWLRFEAPSGRVLAALLAENRGQLLSEASFTRLRNALASDQEAFFAARSARSRARTVRAPATASPERGQLTLTREPSGMRLFVTWPALSSALLDQARSTARSAAWRPRLWGKGGFLHPDAALGTGPFALALQAPPADDEASYPDASIVFGAGSDAAAMLAARTVDWSDRLFFDPNDDRTQAEQRFDPPAGQKGFVWIATKATTGPLQLRQLGSVCGYFVYEANLADAANRDLLKREGMLTETVQTILARHPLDAIGAPRRTVRPDRPFLLYRTDEHVVDVKPQWLPVDTRDPGVQGLRVERAPRIDDAVVDVFLFERDAAFDALTQRRLQLRVESVFPLIDTEIVAELEIDGRLIARGTERLATLPVTIPETSPLFAPLYEDRTRSKLLNAGRGLLRIAVGRSVELSVSLERPLASVEWDDNRPSLVGADIHSELVAASALRPHRFEQAAGIDRPVRGGAAFGLKLGDGRIADPVQIITSTTFDLSDLTAQFGNDVGLRRKYYQGRGVGDIARARAAWARGLCRSLSAVAVKGRVVRQFDEPLVIDLCGNTWWRSEQSSRASHTDPHGALLHAAIKHDLATLPPGIEAEDHSIFWNAFRRQAMDRDPEWPRASEKPVGSSMDDALNAAFTETVIDLHEKGKLLEVDEDDCDFGSIDEDWEEAAAEALANVRRRGLVKLLVPSEGGRQLSHRPYADVSLAELAEDLSAWTKTWALPRGHLSAELAASALLLWLSPAACDDVERVIHVLASDPFVARATRYAALRLDAAAIGMAL